MKKRIQSKAVFDCMINSTAMGLLLMVVVLFITPKTPTYYFVGGMALISLLRPYLMYIMHWELRTEISKHLHLEYDEEEEEMEMEE